MDRVKDGCVCEYVAGVENAEEEFGRFILANFNFLSIIVMKFRAIVQHKLWSAMQMKIRDRKPKRVINL